MDSPHKFSRRIFEFLVSREGCWFVMKMVGIGSFKKVAYLRNRELALRKYREISTRIRQKIEKEGLQVHDGPFSGLRYTSFASRGSTLLPKLLGTYECELHSAIEGMPLDDFPLIVDIGCAEGYYAVGFAMRCKNANIHAYDIEEMSRNLCRGMAEANQVSDRVTVLGECTPDTLVGHDFSRGGLIVSDCEGYERVLFTPDTAPHLEMAHILIELHEMKGEGLAEKIRTVFTKTHDFMLIQSMTDDEKISTCSSRFVNMDEPSERRIAFEEMRGARMFWMVLTPKQKESV